MSNVYNALPAQHSLVVGSDMLHIQNKLTSYFPQKASLPYFGWHCLV